MSSFDRAFFFRIIALVGCFLLGMTSFGAMATSTTGNPICSTTMLQGVSAQVDRYVTAKNEFVGTAVTPPAQVSQVANTPCMSSELQRITSSFSSQLSMYSTQVTSPLTGGLIGGLMMQFFKSETTALNSAASLVSSAFNFQSMASSALTSTLGSFMDSLGLGSAFSSQLCGLMIDMLLTYLQCQNPIQLPNLGNLFGSLDSLIPNNCLGSALRSTLYGAGSMQGMRTMNQPITITNGGTFVPGNAETLNQQKGVYTQTPRTTNGNLY